MTGSPASTHPRQGMTRAYYAVALGALTIGVATFWSQPDDLWPARIALLLLWLGMIGLLLHRSLAFLLLSPIAVMGGLSLFAFSFLPALMPLQARYFDALHNWVSRFPWYLDSFAETLIVGFSAAFLVVLALMATFYERRGTAALPTTMALHPWLRIGLAIVLVISLVLQAVWSANTTWPRLFAPTGIWLQVHHALPPLQTAVLTALFIDALSRGGRAVAIVVVLVVAATIVLVSAGTGKVPVFHLLALALAWFALSALSLKRRLGILSAAAAALMFVMAIAPVFRPGEVGWQRTQEKAVYVVKLLWSKSTGRQFMTGRCLQDVVKAHWPARGEGRPFYFLVGLVPRVLWPEKPSLSKGQGYAVRYCGTPPGGVHTASVTLLGEPIIQAGAVGLAVAMATLVVALSAATWAAFATAPYGLVALVALFPWLIDFDQHFALYWANAVKMGIVVVGVLFAVMGLQRYLDRRGRSDAA